MAAVGVGRLGKPLYQATSGLAQFYDQCAFSIEALASMPSSLRHRNEIAARIADITVGPGAFLIGGGIFFVIVAVEFGLGAAIGLGGFALLKGVDAQAFTGAVAALGEVRVAVPLMSGVILAAQIGCGFTAELGAMRVSDEIDAMEVMGVPSIPYLVGTRLWAALITLVPVYLASLLSGFLFTMFFVTVVNHLPTGVYLHYFTLLVSPKEILLSLVQATIYSVAAVLVHCYYGFTATGGPAGVGSAAGRAIRFSLIAIVLLQMVLSILFYGGGTATRIVG